MGYSGTHPVRRAGGRLALDFLNTADWTADGAVAHEKLETLADLTVWLRAVGLPDAGAPGSVAEIHAFREQLRTLFTSGHADPPDVSNLIAAIAPVCAAPATPLPSQPLLTQVAYSALALLGDATERARIKMCPANDCGWLFLDETKNGRRKWCLMETCGNRAKAARNYRKRQAGTTQEK